MGWYVEMSYKLHKTHKLNDWLEQQATEWVQSSILDYFNVDNIFELTQQQIQEVVEEWETFLDQPHQNFVTMALRNNISDWESEHGIEVI